MSVSGARSGESPAVIADRTFQSEPCWCRVARVRRCRVRGEQRQAASGAPAAPAVRHAFPARPAARRRAHHRGGHAGELAPRARPSCARPRPRRPRAGTPRRPSIPSPAWCAAPAAAGDRPVPQVRGNVWRKWCGSGSRSCSASSTAQAIASPSSVAVPRPISSTTTSERGPAWCRMAAVSVISTMKVERPRARSSAAPTRREQPVHHADARGFRRHRQAGLGEHDDQRVLPQEGGFAGHVRPGQQQHAPVRRQVAIVRHEGGVRRRAPLPPPGWRPARDLRSCVVVGDDRAAPGAGLRPGVAADCSDVQQWPARRRRRRARRPGPAWPRPDAANTARSRAAARSPASVMRRSSSDSSGVVKRAPLAMPWRSVSSGKSRSFSTAAAGASMT